MADPSDRGHSRTDTVIGERRFTREDQTRFAELSGDHNPIHVDPVAVRRTLPGRLVVHGVHIVLWSFGLLADTIGRDLPPIARVRVRFLRFTHVGDHVVAQIVSQTNSLIQMRVTGDGIVRAELWINLGPPAGGATVMAGGAWHHPGQGPVDNTDGSYDRRRGRLSFLGPAGAMSAFLPDAERWLGSGRINALAAASRLVGMIYPGLHSILGGMDVRLTADDGSAALGFAMGEQRHGQIDAAVAGGGIAGHLDCRIPPRPVIQPSSEALRRLVPPGRYAGASVLVVGGSRGVGEAIAKLAALGGADVVVTYREGASDAAAVAADIEAAGGRCAVRRYDTAQPVDDQLGELAPTHACWLATPVMASPQATTFDAERSATCRSILVTCFHTFATALQTRRPDLRILNPSMTWIETPPPGMIEYLIAKAAGEIVARHIEATMPPVRVLTPRLPPMATDQTARLGLADMAASAADTILPALDRLIRGGDRP